MNLCSILGTRQIKQNTSISQRTPSSLFRKREKKKQLKCFNLMPIKYFFEYKKILCISECQ